MSLFHFKKKKENQNNRCCCDCNQVNSVKVLGAGCKTCHQQYENVKEAVENLALNVTTEYITDMEKVMEYGVMTMPVVVIDEKIASAGKLLSTKEVEKLLRGNEYEKTCCC